MIDYLVNKPHPILQIIYLGIIAESQANNFDEAPQATMNDSHAKRPVIIHAIKETRYML